MTLATGTQLGRYEILSQLGVGGMGEVYLAEDTQLHRHVALKVLPVEVASNQDRNMITRDGYAKILGFGLAKLIEPGERTQGLSSELATAIMQQHSAPGMIMGTAGYMSPEQAQGKIKEIDQYRRGLASRHLPPEGGTPKENHVRLPKNDTRGASASDGVSSSAKPTVAFPAALEFGNDATVFG